MIFVVSGGPSNDYFVSPGGWVGSERNQQRITLVELKSIVGGWHWGVGGGYRIFLLCMTFSCLNAEIPLCDLWGGGHSGL